MNVTKILLVGAIALATSSVAMATCQCGDPDSGCGPTECFTNEYKLEWGASSVAQGFTMNEGPVAALVDQQTHLWAPWGSQPVQDDTSPTGVGGTFEFNTRVQAFDEGLGQAGAGADASGEAFFKEVYRWTK